MTDRADQIPRLVRGSPITADWLNRVASAAQLRSGGKPAVPGQPGTAAPVAAEAQQQQAETWTVTAVTTDEVVESGTGCDVTVTVIDGFTMVTPDGKTITVTGFSAFR